MGGKLVTLKEQAGEAPNGTAFMITTGPTPELDKTNLVVGKVSSDSNLGHAACVTWWSESGVMSRAVNEHCKLGVLAQQPAGNKYRCTCRQSIRI